MTYTLPNSKTDLLADTDQPRRPPSLESWLLAMGGTLAFLGGLTNQLDFATPIINGMGMAAICIAFYQVGMWAYHRFQNGQ